MGANQSVLHQTGTVVPTSGSGTGTASATSKSSSTTAGPSTASVFTSTSREHELWLSVRFDRLLDDGYINEWHKKNDLANWIEKEKKKSTNKSATQASAATSGHEDHSESYEQIYSFLGPNFHQLQSARLSAIVSEIFQAGESAQLARSVTTKRELFVRRVHAAIEAQRGAKAKGRNQTSLTTTTPTSPTTTNLLASLSSNLTPGQQQEELKKLPLPQQLSIRWLLSMLQSMQQARRISASPSTNSTALVTVTSSSSSATASSGPLDPALVSFFLQQLLPILDELTPLLASEERGKLGVMEAVEEFLMRVFEEQGLLSTTSSSSSTPSFPIAQVTASLLALALSRARFSTILAILQPILLSHISSSPVLDALPSKPQNLLKRIRLIEGPKPIALARGARRSSISAGGSTSRQASALLAWGTSQNSGKLGFGSAAATKKNPTPIPEFDSDRVVSVSSFQNHTLLVDNEYHVYGFGSNENYRLGFEDVTPRASPTLIPFFNDKRVIQVSVGNEFSVCLTAEGQVYCFGDGQNNKLCHGSTSPAKVPVLVQQLVGQKVTAIECGGYHTLAMTASHELYAWGKNSRGQLGNGTNVDSNPVQIKAFSGVPLKQLAAGWEHSVVLTQDGSVFSFGGGYDNKPVTGHGSDSVDQKTPKLVAAFVGVEVTYIACGWDHTLFITQDGSVWACGDGSGGRLGCGDVSDQVLPKRIRGFTSGSDSTETKIVACDGGEGHSTFIGIDGSVWSAGSDGTNGAAIKTVPQKLDAPRPMRFVTCGGKMTFGLSGLPAIGGVPQEAVVDTITTDERANFFDPSSILSHPSLLIPSHPDTTRTTKSTAFMLLSQLDRLAAQQNYERDATRSTNSSTLNLELLTAPYCIEATPEILSKLFDIVGAYTKHVGQQLNESESRRAAGLPPLIDSAANATKLAEFHAQLAATKAARLAAEAEEIANCKDVHRSVTCDHCRQSPLIGARWKCDVCPDFDYCTACKTSNPEIQSHKKSHTFTRYAIATTGYQSSQPMVMVNEPDPDPPEESADWHDSYVLIAALRLLKANFTRLIISQVPLDSIGIELPHEDDEKVEEKSDSTTTAATKPKFSVSELQTYLLRLVDGDLGFPTSTPSPSTSSTTPTSDSSSTKIDTSASSGSANTDASTTLSPSDHVRELSESLRREAVLFLRVGMEVFYSTQRAKESLVESLLDSSSNRSQYLAPALLGRLAEDSMVTAFVPQLPQPITPKKKASEKKDAKSTQSTTATTSAVASSLGEEDSPVLIDGGDDDEHEEDEDGENENGEDDEEEDGHEEVEAAEPNEPSSNSFDQMIISQSQSLIASAASLLADQPNPSIVSGDKVDANFASGDLDASSEEDDEHPHDEDGGSVHEDGDEEQHHDDDALVSAVPAPASEADVLPPFNCPICTFANDAGVNECQMCGSPRPDLSGSNDSFQESLAHMQQQIQNEQAQLIAEQSAALEQQQILLAQQLSNAVAGAAAMAFQSIPPSTVIASESPSGPNAPASSPSAAVVQQPPASLFQMISSMAISPQQASASPMNLGLPNGNSISLQLLSPSMAFSPPSQPTIPVFNDHALMASGIAEQVQLNGVDQLASPAPASSTISLHGTGSPNMSAISMSFASPLSESGSVAPSSSNAASSTSAPIPAALSAEDEAAALAASQAQEVLFKTKSKQLCSLLHRLVTATALDIRAQLTTASTQPSSTWETLPVASPTIDPRLQFLLSLQTRALSWAASCAEQYKKEQEKPTIAGSTIWLDVYYRSHVISLNAIRQYAELVLDASLELCEHANTIITEKVATTPPSDATLFFPIHIMHLLQHSLVGLSLPSLLLAVGLFPTSPVTFASSLSPKYIALLKSLHQLASSMTTLNSTITSLLPSKEKERQLKKQRKDERERERTRLRDEKLAKKAEKRKLKEVASDGAASVATAVSASEVDASSSSATPEKSESKETEEEKKDDNSTVEDAHTFEKEVLTTFNDRCVEQLAFLTELQREASWLMASVIETELGDHNLEVANNPQEDITLALSRNLSLVTPTKSNDKSSNSTDPSPFTSPSSTILNITSPALVESPLEPTPVEFEWLSSDLLKLGLEDGSVGFDEDVDGQPNDDEPDVAPEPLELSRRLTPSSRSAHITPDDAAKFCIDLGENLGIAARLWDWMSIHLKKEIIGKPETWLDRVARTAFAALLKHHGLLAEAISYGRLIVRKGQSLSAAFAPAPELIATWREAQNIRLTCLRSAQQITQTRELEREEKDGGNESTTIASLTTQISPYEQAARPVLACADFLLRISPSLESVTAQSSPMTGVTASFGGLLTVRSRRQSASKWSLLRMLFRVIHRIRFLKFQAALEGFERTYLDRSCFKQTRLFLTSGVDCQRMEQLMELRSKQAVKRLHALRKLQSLLTMLPAPICQVELLGGLRRSMYQRNILDGIDGCGSILIGLMRKQFTKLMGEVTRMVGLDSTSKANQPVTIASLFTSTPTSVRLAALGCWVFKLRREISDHALIAHVGIIQAVKDILSTASQLQPTSSMASVPTAQPSLTLTTSSSSTTTTDDTAKQPSHSDLKDAKKLISTAWKVLKLLSCELGIGVRSCFGSDSSADAQLDQHSPYLETILEVLYQELHRSLVALSRGELEPASFGAHARGSSSYTFVNPFESSLGTLKEIPVFGAIPITNGCMELVKSKPISLKSSMLGYSYSITNPVGYAPIDVKEDASKKVAPASITKASLFGSAPAAAATPSTTTTSSPPSNKMDFSVAFWLFIPKETVAAGFSSSSSAMSQLITLRATGPMGAAQYLPAILLNDADSRLKVLISTTGGGNTPESTLSVNKLPIRKWCHVVVTLSDKVLTIYINGEQDTNKTLTSGAKPFSATADEIHIGRVRSRVGPSFPIGFEGQIGSFSFWHRAITSANAKDLVSNGHPRSNFYLTYSNRIVSLLGSLDGLPFFLSRKWMRLFLWLLHHGEVSIRVRMLRLLRRLLPNISPKKAQYLLMGDNRTTNQHQRQTSLNEFQLGTAASASGAGLTSFDLSSTAADSPSSPIGLQSLDDDQVSGNGERLMKYFFDLVSAHSLTEHESKDLMDEWSKVITLPPYVEPIISPSNAAASTKDGATKPDSTVSTINSLLPTIVPTLLQNAVSSADLVEEAESESTVAAETVMLLRHLLNIPSDSSHPTTIITSANSAVLPSASPKLSPTLSPAGQLPQNLPSFWPTIITTVMASTLKEIPAALKEQQKERSRSTPTSVKTTSPDTTISEPVKSTGIAGSAFFGASSTSSPPADTPATDSVSSPSSSLIISLDGPPTSSVPRPSLTYPFVRALTSLDVLGGHVPSLRLGAACIIKSAPSIPTTYQHQPAHIIGYQTNRQSVEVTIQTNGAADIPTESDDNQLSTLPMTSTCDVNWLQPIDEITISSRHAASFVTELLPIFQLVIKEYQQQIQTLVGHEKKPNESKEQESKMDDNSSPTSIVSSTTPSTCDLLISHVGSRLIKVMSTLLTDSTVVSKLIHHIQLPELVFMSAMPVMLDTPNSSQPTSNLTTQTLEDQRAQLWQVVRHMKEEALAQATTNSNTPQPTKDESIKTATDSKFASSSSDSELPKEKTPLELEQDSKINDLSGMGFDKSFCRKALERTKWDASNAADWLLSHMELLEREKVAEEEAAKKSKLAEKISAEKAALESEVKDGDIKQLKAMMNGLALTPESEIPEYTGKDTCEEFYEIDYFPSDQTGAALLDITPATTATSNSSTLPISLSNLPLGLPSNDNGFGSGLISSSGLAATGSSSGWSFGGTKPSLTSPTNATKSKLVTDQSAPTSTNIQTLLTTIQRVDAALSILYARESVLTLLHHWPSDSLESLTADSLGEVTVLTRLFKLSTFRQTIPPNISGRTMENTRELNVFKRLLATDCSLRKFALEESLRHLTKAATPTYAAIGWNRRRVEENDVGSLSSSRVEFAEWVIKALLDLRYKALTKKEFNNAIQPSDGVVSLETFKRLLVCLNTTNLCLREVIVQLLNSMLHILMITPHEVPTSIEPTSPFGPYVSVLPTTKIESMLNKRVRSEEGKFLSSSYAIALLDLSTTMVTFTQKHQQFLNATDANSTMTEEEVNLYLQQTPTLQTEEVAIYAVDLVWSIPSKRRLIDSDINRFHYILEMSDGTTATTITTKWDPVYIGPGIAWLQDGLAEHTAYRFRVCLLDTITHKRGPCSSILSVKTAAGLQWSDTSASEAGCTITPDGLSATFVTSSSKWRTVLANRAYSSGTHSWFIKLDRLQGNNIFVGVAKSNCIKTNYIGFDMFSWSVYGKEGRRFVQNNRLPDKPAVAGGLVAWKNENMATGDCIKLTLDCDAGILTLQRNGNELGVAFDFLPKNEPLYPAVSFNTNGDKVTITQCSNTASSAPNKEKAKFGVAPSEPVATLTKKDSPLSANDDPSIIDWRVRTVQRMHWCATFLEAITHHGAFPSSITQLIYARAVQFIQQQTRKLDLGDGSSIQIDLSPSVCQAAGVTLGERVSTGKNGSGIVLGIEVSGRRRRREIAAQISESSSLNWADEIERQRTAEAAVEEANKLSFPATDYSSSMTWSELMGDVKILEPVVSVDQAPEKFHPGAILNGQWVNVDGAYDASLIHPAAIAIVDPVISSPFTFGTPPSASSAAVASSSSSSFSLTAPLVTPVAPPMTPINVNKQLSFMFSAAGVSTAKPAAGSSPSAPTLNKVLSFSPPKETVIWVKMDGQDDPVPVLISELKKTAQAEEVKETEEKKEHEEKKEETNSTESSITTNSSEVAPAVKFQPWTYSSFLALLQSSTFTVQVDGQLVHYINSLADSVNCQPAALVLHDLQLHPPNSQLYPALANLTIESLAIRFCLLRTFNLFVSRILLDVERLTPMQARSTFHPHFSLGVQLSHYRDLLFTRLKLKHFHKLVDQTCTPTKPSDDPYELAPGIKTITLNRHKAAKARERGSPTSRALYSMVGQTQAELGHWQPSELRRHYTKMDDGGQIRTFVVKFAGEGVRDNGGVYSELITSLAEELFSPTPILPYFIRTPNARGALGSNQDGWMPNPVQTSHAALATYRFIGEMIGVAIRGNIQLNFNVAPIFWKALVGQKLSLHDLEECDCTMTQTFTKMHEEAKRMQAANAAGVSSSPAPDEFGTMFGVDSFTCLLSDGVTVVELVPGGASKPVTLDNYQEWIELCTAKRLHESDLQISALRTGLAAVIPTQLFSFFSWFELQHLVCGLPDFPVSLLQSVTRYEGKMSPDVEYIRWFWSILGEMTPTQKSQFMRFVFARDRLPARPAELGIKFKIQDPLASAMKDPNSHFPSTHTCFFSISFPPYTSRAALKEKLLYAMNTCHSMDGDLVLKDSELYDWNADDIATR